MTANRANRNTRARRCTTTPVICDTLESRRMFMIGTDGLSPDVLDMFYEPPTRSPGDVYVEAGILKIIGNDFGDTAIVNRSGSEVSVIFNDWEPQIFNAADVSQAQISLGGGNDLAQVSGLPAYIELGAGDDYVTGSELNDTITAGAGHDVVIGGAGDDRLNGNGGRDKLRGGDGNDRCYGGDANDQIEGGNGTDRIFCDGGNDFANGAGSNDLIYGGEGSDTLVGGKGNDLVWGDGGNDIVNSIDSLGDTVDGGDGDDKCAKGKDLDQLFNVETPI